MNAAYTFQPVGSSQYKVEPSQSNQLPRKQSVTTSTN